MLRKNVLKAQNLSRITRTSVSRTRLCRPCACYGFGNDAKFASLTRTYSTKLEPASSGSDKIIQKLVEAAEEQARRGDGFDANVNNPTELFDSLSDEEKSEFVMDPHRVEEILAYAKQYWRRHLKLPAGWHSLWEKWDLLHTFYYPSPHYFLQIPQIDVVLNVRYAIPGEGRPLMYNNDLEAFFFEVVERGSGPPRADRALPEKPRPIYLMDWKAEELYLVEDASTVKQISLIMVSSGGLQGLKKKRIESDVEGEKIIERLLEEDDTVIPELVDKYLGYSPAPSEDLLEKYLDQTEEVLGGETEPLEDEVEIEPELEKDSLEAHDEIVKMLEHDMEDPEELEQAQELLEDIKELSPEEMKPLRDLLVLLKDTDPSEFENLKDTFARHIIALERDIEEDGKELGELLRRVKKVTK